MHFEKSRVFTNLINNSSKKQITINFPFGIKKYYYIIDYIEKNPDVDTVYIYISVSNNDLYYYLNDRISNEVSLINDIKLYRLNKDNSIARTKKSLLYISDKMYNNIDYYAQVIDYFETFKDKKILLFIDKYANIEFLYDDIQEYIYRSVICQFYLPNSKVNNCVVSYQEAENANLINENLIKRSFISLSPNKKLNLLKKEVLHKFEEYKNNLKLLDSKINPKLVIELNKIGNNKDWKKINKIIISFNPDYKWLYIENFERNIVHTNLDTKEINMLYWHKYIKKLDSKIDIIVYSSKDFVEISLYMGVIFLSFENSLLNVNNHILNHVITDFSNKLSKVEKEKINILLNKCWIYI